MDNIILTLGHNSSAIAVRDGVVLGGYETERFTGKKSDSSYPAQPIEELIKRFDLARDSNIYVGHWFLDANLPIASNKYINYEHLGKHFIREISDGLCKEFSHHDSHVMSAMAFAGHNFAPSYHAFVLDGFGSYGECISVYEVTGGSYKLLNRWFGYEKSLGMFYQYATAYMGMKQHQDEYKVLAYEVHVDPSLSGPIRDYAQNNAAKHVRDLVLGSMDAKFDPMVSLEALPRIQLEISHELDKFCVDFNIDKTNVLEFRSAVSLYVQTFVEAVTLTLVDMYRPKNVLLAGGLFYNVKLNSLIQKQIPGRLCVMPLAGDQGAGLGVYQHYNGDLIWPDNLCWGNRDLNFKSDLDGLIVVDNEAEAYMYLASELDRIGFVNLVRGNMEFGPRALCNTSTLALPEIDVVNRINSANNRNTEMPCAPVMSKVTADKMFVDCDKIFKSLEYMIVTRDYKGEYTGEEFSGVSHYYPDDDVCTGRPQITNDGLMLDLLANTSDDVLCNTSFNYHGVPIVLGKAEIEYSHAMQRSREPMLDIKTIVISGE